MTKILTTNAYSTFKVIKGNRPIIKKKVDNLKRSYLSGIDLFPYCPILVNPDHFVIDGQHRRQACKELGIDVHYIIVPNFSLQQIAEVNSNTDKWKDKDFLACYIDTGNKEYKTLKFFMEKYNLVLTTALGLLYNGKASGGGDQDLKEKFRNGAFMVRKNEDATALIGRVVQYSDVCKKVTDRKFIYAIQTLLLSPTYIHDEVVSKLKKNGSTIPPQSSWKDYILVIEQLYNKDNTKRKIIYQ